MNKEISDILVKYPSLKLNEQQTKVVCSWTNHELPLNKDRLNEYIAGNKYQRLLKAQPADQFNFDDYKEFISPNKARKNKLFCILTYRSLNNQIDHIRKHVEGRRFQKAYALWKECKEKNEVFKSPYKRSSRRTEHAFDGDSDSGEKVIEDNMSDLYPDESGDDDDDDDDVDVDMIVEDEEVMEEEDDEENGIHDNEDEDDDDDDEEVEVVRQQMKRKFNTKITSHKKNQPSKKKFFNGNGNGHSNGNKT